jgi:hypothetical protein
MPYGKVPVGTVTTHNLGSMTNTLYENRTRVALVRAVMSYAVVLYGCETRSLTLREQHRLRVFENRVLRRIFGSNRDEMTGGWRKLHSEELHNLYSKFH